MHVAPLLALFVTYASGAATWLSNMQALNVVRPGGQTVVPLALFFLKRSLNYQNLFTFSKHVVDKQI